jgi:hypothetical protein
MTTHISQFWLTRMQVRFICPVLLAFLSVIFPCQSNATSTVHSLFLRVSAAINPKGHAKLEAKLLLFPTVMEKSEALQRFITDNVVGCKKSGFRFYVLGGNHLFAACSQLYREDPIANKRLGFLPVTIYLGLPKLQRLYVRTLLTVLVLQAVMHTFMVFHVWTADEQTPQPHWQHANEVLPPRQAHQHAAGVGESGPRFRQIRLKQLQVEIEMEEANLGDFEHWKRFE